MFVSLARCFPLIERARATSIVMIAAEVGTAVTPLIVIPLQKYCGWRIPFFALALIGRCLGCWIETLVFGEGQGRILSRARLDGLHHRYEHAA
jgi:predicted MFS family arabinose efflux permease